MKALLVLLLALTFHCSWSQDKEKEKDCPEIKIKYQVKHCSANKNDGEITLDIKGGQAPYNVQWIAYDFNEKGLRIKNLKAGYYSAIVWDKERCIQRIDNIRVELSKDQN